MTIAEACLNGMCSTCEDPTCSCGTCVARRQLQETPHARRVDPDTSHTSARRAKPRMTAQVMKLLAVFEEHGDLTREEASYAVQGDNRLWRRCSDLLRWGWIEWTGERRESREGGVQRVYQITDLGRKELESSRAVT